MQKFAIYLWTLVEFKDATNHPRQLKQIIISIVFDLIYPWFWPHISYSSILYDFIIHVEMKVLYYIHLFLGVMGLSFASPSETIQHLTFESTHSQWHEDRVTEERFDLGNLMQIICISVMHCSMKKSLIM